MIDRNNVLTMPDQTGPIQTRSLQTRPTQTKPMKPKSFKTVYQSTSGRSKRDPFQSMHAVQSIQIRPHLTIHEVEANGFEKIRPGRTKTYDLLIDQTRTDRLNQNSTDHAKPD